MLIKYRLYDSYGHILPYVFNTRSEAEAYKAMNCPKATVKECVSHGF